MDIASQILSGLAASSDGHGRGGQDGGGGGGPGGGGGGLSSVPSMADFGNKVKEYWNTVKTEQVRRWVTHFPGCS